MTDKENQSADNAENSRTRRRRQPTKETAAKEEKAPQPATTDVFKSLDDVENAAEKLQMIGDVPVKLNVELGRKRMSIKELLKLGQGSVVELEGLAGDPMTILVNNYPIASGEVVVVDDKYGIRITDIITPSERVAKLNQN